MKTTITFYIVRHGKTLMNTLERVQGWCDSPLTDEGVAVAKDLGAGFRKIKFDAVYTSDLRRTRQTAQILLDEKGQPELPITEMKEFRECCFGSYESGENSRMWTDASIYLHYNSPEKMSEAIFRKEISGEHVLNAISSLDKLGIAETFEQLETRTHLGLKLVAEKESAKGKPLNILLVAHGMSITAMLHNLGGRELQKNHLLNASVSKVIYEDGIFKTLSVGDMSYAENGAKLRI
ncbi:histidine phosphatase family protein [Dysgonomonas sp. 216]|uniref:histidine phosphatase family protein n=1 Tax=Dysgonomonas sp. 216 TaxID=2302934 RepID=UPI0013D41DB5|nr:histidine phosphatase family protein [Dysgonomonas sp. 216]NDW17637.1 histidine phosphatase family protein [Dysgonomonas sp. 216]